MVDRIISFIVAGSNISPPGRNSLKTSASIMIKTKVKTRMPIYQRGKIRFFVKNRNAMYNHVSMSPMLITISPMTIIASVILYDSLPGVDSAVNVPSLKIAEYDEKKYDALIVDQGIIRNKLKIRSAISNARAFIKIQIEFGSFSNYIWNFVEHKPINLKRSAIGSIPANTDLSNTVSKDLKKRGFKFVGTTVVYAYMQAVGMVNDHVEDCFRNIEILNH